MEKLIELLNEFYKEKGDIFRAIQHNVRLKVFELENNDLVRDTAIISKEYGFIKRLVENNKIDTNKLEKIGYVETIYRYDGKYRDIVEYSDYESLLMLLSIQDDPISFLISILK